MSTDIAFAAVLTGFFSQRLINQKQASPHTVSAYRDSWRLLLQFVCLRDGKGASSLAWEDIDAPTVCAFLQDLQQQRGISSRSRNLRLTAIRSFFKYASFEVPDRLHQFQRILAIPAARCIRRKINFLSPVEVDALLEAVDQDNWAGRRDHAWLLLAVQTGLRVSEITGLKRSDVQFGSGAYVHVVGKGRKERSTPLTKQVIATLKDWLAEPDISKDATLFPSCRGERLSNDGVQYLLAKHIRHATKAFPSLENSHVTPHVLRHTAAMELLKAGVDVSVIALWLGHESIETTHIYLEADLDMKRKALEKVSPHEGKSSQFKPDDALMSYLKSL